MLKPSMNELMKKVGNRYLLVNLAAQRARDIAEEAEQTGEPLEDKAVKLALDEIAAGTIVYKPGAKTTTPDIPMIREMGTLDFDDDEDVEEIDLDEEGIDEDDEDDMDEVDE